MVYLPDHRLHHSRHLVHRVVWRAMQAVLLYGKQFLPQLQHFLASGKGLNIHDDQITFAIFSQVNRLTSCPAQLRNIAISL